MVRLKQTPIPDENPWRVFRIMAEFVEGFDELSQIGPAVSIFGSARTKLDQKYYKAPNRHLILSLMLSLQKEAGLMRIGINLENCTKVG